MAYDIFISYRRTDQALARLIVNALEQRGISVWWDQMIEGGVDWREAIVDALSVSSALVILFSEESNASKQLKKELAIADTLDKDVVPVLIEQTQPKGHYLYELAARNWLQVFPEPEQKIDSLTDRLVEVALGNRIDGAPPQHENMDGRAVPSKPVKTSPAPREVAKTPSTSKTNLPAHSQTHSVSTPEEPKAVSDTSKIESRVSAATSKKQLRDILPFKWYEILIAVLLGGVTAFASLELLESTPLFWFFDWAGVTLLSLIIIGLLVFPFRYYFRNRRVWRAFRAFTTSILLMVIVVIPLIAFDTRLESISDNALEEVIFSGLGALILGFAASCVAFGIYGLLHFQRTLRSYRANIETI